MIWGIERTECTQIARRGGKAPISNYDMIHKMTLVFGVMSFAEDPIQPVDSTYLTSKEDIVELLHQPPVNHKQLLTAGEGCLVYRNRQSQIMFFLRLKVTPKHNIIVCFYPPSGPRINAYALATATNIGCLTLPLGGGDIIADSKGIIVMSIENPIHVRQILPLLPTEKWTLIDMHYADDLLFIISDHGMIVSNAGPVHNYIDFDDASIPHDYVTKVPSLSAICLQRDPARREVTTWYEHQYIYLTIRTTPTPKNVAYGSLSSRDCACMVPTDVVNGRSWSIKVSNLYDWVHYKDCLFTTRLTFQSDSKGMHCYDESTGKSHKCTSDLLADFLPYIDHGVYSGQCRYTMKHCVGRMRTYVPQPYREKTAVTNRIQICTSPDSDDE